MLWKMLFELFCSLCACLQIAMSMVLLTLVLQWLWKHCPRGLFYLNAFLMGLKLVAGEPCCHHKCHSGIVAVHCNGH